MCCHYKEYAVFKIDDFLLFDVPWFFSAWVGNLIWYKSQIARLLEDLHDLPNDKPIAN